MIRNRLRFIIIGLFIVLLVIEVNPTIAEEGFKIHFLDVGQADAAVVLCDGKSLMIDGGNVSDSSLVYSYLKNALHLDHLDYMIATHPHEDHVGGLVGALNACTVGIVFSPCLEYESKAFNSFQKYVHEQSREISIPPIGETFFLGSSSVQFLSPSREYAEINDNSVVVRIVYGNTSFLFAGDAEWDAEHDMVVSGFELESTLLKVAHHGSESSSSYVFLRAVAPRYAVISVGAGNQYGHPAEDTLSRLSDAGAEIYRTDLQGDIICTSDGNELVFSTKG